MNNQHNFSSIQDEPIKIPADDDNSDFVAQSNPLQVIKPDLNVKPPTSEEIL